MTYIYCKKVIQGGKYKKPDMLEKLDVFLLNDRIAKEEYDELIKLMG